MDRQSSKITAIYCRLAHYDGHRDLDRATARNQMERLIQYATNQGLENVKLFCDWGFSGLDCKRPQYQRMTQAIEAGSVSDLIVLDYSRLGRNYQMCNGLVETLLPQHGITFHAVQDGVIYTPQALNELAVQHKALYASLCQMRRERGRK